MLVNAYNLWLYLSENLLVNAAVCLHRVPSHFSANLHVHERMMLYVNCKPVLHVCNVQCGDERGVHDAGMQSMHPCCCMHGYVPARRCTHKSTCACMYVGMHASARVRVCVCVCVRS